MAEITLTVGEKTMTLPASDEAMANVFINFGIYEGYCTADESYNAKLGKSFWGMLTFVRDRAGLYLQAQAANEADLSSIQLTPAPEPEPTDGQPA